MAVTRQGTFGAENHSVAHLDLFGGQTSSPLISDVAKTGAHSYQHDGSAFGRTFPATAIRSVCAVRNGGVTTPGRLPIVTIGVGYAPLSVMWEPAVGELKLMAGFEEWDTVYRYPVAAVPETLFASSPSTWKIIGIAAKIDAVAGYVSFYIEGQKLITWTGDTRIYAMDSDVLLDSITGVYWLGDEYDVTFTDEYYPIGEWGADALVDDLTIESLTGADAVDAMPRYRSLIWALAGTNGSTIQWTPVGAPTNDAAVKENPPDDAISYVTTATINRIDEYVVAQPIPLAGYTPEVVTVVARGKRASTEGVNKVALLTKIGEASSVAAAQPLPTDWNEIESTFWTKPDGITAWDAMSLTALKIGIKSSE